MNRIVFAVVILLIIGACLPSNLLPVSLLQPTADAPGPTQANAPATASETAALQPTDTIVPVTDTSAPPTDSPPATATETATSSPIPNLTTTFATATELVVTPDGTATLVSGDSGTTTSTPSHLTYGTLPPENRPFSEVTLFNRSHVEAYISLQVSTRDYGSTIIEYYVDRMVRIRAPVGYYLYVAWVGGNKMVGNFRLTENDDLSIFLYKNRVVIQ